MHEKAIRSCVPIQNRAAGDKASDMEAHTRACIIYILGSACSHSGLHGWTDAHLHEFRIKSPKTGRKVNIGLPDEDFGRKVSPGWKKKIADFFTPANPKAEYTYDFGDNWRHIISLEDILPRQKGVDYPMCVGGERACPPEDCGSSYGYKKFLDIVMDPGHEEHDSMLKWAGGEFHPEHFDCAEVIFDDPAERLEKLYEDF